MPELILHTKNLKENILKVESIPDLRSDHLHMILKLDLEKSTTAECKILRYNYDKCDMKKVNKDMAVYVGEHNVLTSEEDITTFNQKLSKSIRRNYMNFHHSSSNSSKTNAECTENINETPTLNVIER
ncbi:hypothetical protein HHI36_004656 [Cryptolaemus montrouzieri]|uniref:Uncharacterized protein n=1 Tax=Cryptolaemus montrouzieri TaxID=559131 RepID=A0ABD2NSG6_9CUCU